MGIQFSSPWALLTLILIVPAVVYMFRSDKRLSGFRKKLAVSVRACVLLLLVFAIAGMQVYQLWKDKDVVIVADRSDSMPDGASVTDWIKRSTAFKDAKERFALVSTGLDAAVERSLSNDAGGIDFTAQMSRQFSNMEQGLQVADSLIRVPESSRIVLVSDGEENVGSMLRHGKLLKDRGIAVDVLPVAPSSAPDVSVEQLKIPEKLYQAEKFAFETTLRSTIAAKGELRIYEDSRELAVAPVVLEKGENRFVLQGLAREPGLHRYRAEIFVDGDSQAANNAGYAYSRVTGVPKVLIVEGKPGISANMEKALESGLVRYETIEPETFPKELAKLTAYDSIVLNDVSAERFSGSQLEMIERAVSTYGIGLMMVGGEDSFGMGGYFKTPVEKALPVRMELEGKREIPSLGLILVIDRSGSMSGDKMELAKEAAMRTVELMRAKDTVGVVAFDSQPFWVVEPQKLTDKKKVLSQIQSIQSDGGTEIYPALNMGFQELKKIDAQRKHMILLTDGQSATNSGYDAMLKEMVAGQMTLSTVAVGDDADQQLLGWLAKAAKGRYYFTNDQSTLPAIFSREAVLMSRTYIVNEPFVPVLGGSSDWVKLFADGVPRINGYVATTSKETAETVLLSPEPDPLLARWQYGSGRSVAWTSDLTGKWSHDFVGWDRFTDVFTQMVKWTFPQFAASAFEVNTSLSGDQAEIRVSETDSEAAWDEIRATITDDRLQSQEITLSQTSPGEYAGVLPHAQAGAYVVRLTPASGGKAEETVSENAGFVVPYSPEYRIAPPDASADALKRLAEITGGRVLSFEKPEEVFAAPAEPRKEATDVRYALLLLALLLWLLDIAVRRLSVRWELAAAWVKAPLRLLPGSRFAAGGPAADAAGSDRAQRLERLRQRKRSAGQFLDERGESGGQGGDAAKKSVPALRPHTPKAASAPLKPQKDTRPAAADLTKPGGAPTVPPQPDSQADRLNRLLDAKNRGGRKG